VAKSRELRIQSVNRVVALTPALIWDAFTAAENPNSLILWTCDGKPAAIGSSVGFVLVAWESRLPSNVQWEFDKTPLISSAISRSFGLSVLSRRTIVSLCAGMRSMTD
jgi:hypothetical protein